MNTETDLENTKNTPAANSESNVVSCIGGLSEARVLKAKAAFTTRRVRLQSAQCLLTSDRQPKSGDLLLARVDRLGSHRRIELACGRRAQLFPGDEIILCYGDRYAPDQFEGVVPEDLGACHMVAAGGVAARALSKHTGKKDATRITPLGLLGDVHGKVLNVADWSLPTAMLAPDLPGIIAVAGTAMNAGKTMTVAHLVKGLTHAGQRVGAAKLTGTGAGGDIWLMSDAGAVRVLDFTDAGLASTWRRSLPELVRVMTTLIAHLQEEQVDTIVLELADGLFQDETSALLTAPEFRRLVDGVVFAAGDAMGAYTGVNWLHDHDLPALAVSGRLTASPLASREAQGATGLPVLGLPELSSPDIDTVLADCLRTIEPVQRRTG